MNLIVILKRYFIIFISVQVKTKLFGFIKVVSLAHEVL